MNLTEVGGPRILLQIGELVDTQGDSRFTTSAVAAPNKAAGWR